MQLYHVVFSLDFSLGGVVVIVFLEEENMATQVDCV